MDATGNFGMTDCKVFVGGLPFDADKEAVYEALGAWDGVVQIFYKGSGGWATAEFTSKKRRDEFVRNKDRYNRILNVKVDIKEFSDKSKPSNSNNSAALPVSPAKPVPTSAPAAFMSGSIMDYVNGKKAVFGVIRARPPNEDKKVVFHAASVYYCGTHRLMCSSSACPGFQPLHRSVGINLKEAMPPGTQVSYLQRSITFREVPFSLQATVVWPSLSKQPKCNPDDDELSLLLLDYISAPAAQVNKSSSDAAHSAAGPKPFANVKEATPPFSRPQDQDSDFMATASSSSIPSQQSSLLARPDRDVRALRQIFDELKLFLESNIRPLGVSKSVSALAKKLMTTAAASLGKANASASGVLILMKFLKDQGVHQAKQKDVLSAYKVHHEVMALRLKLDVEDIDLVDKVIDEGARRAGAVGQEKQQAAKRVTGEGDAAKNPIGAAAVMLTNSDGSGDAPEIANDRGVAARCPKFLVPSGNVFLPADLAPKVGGFSDSQGYFETVQVSNDHLKQHMAKWLKQELYPSARSRMVHVFTELEVVNAVLKTWMDGARPPLRLKEELWSSLDRPSSLLSSWAAVAEKAWSDANADHPCAAVDFVVRCSVLHYWDSLIKNNIPAAGDNARFRRLLTDPPYKSEAGGVFNLRGVVARHFGQSVGVAVTHVGPVFFGGDVAYVPSQGLEGKEWSTCSSEVRLQMPAGTIVRLHVAKAPKNKERGGYLYATKVWAPSLSGYHEEEPIIGPEVPGGEKYWRQLFAEIEKIIRVNPTFCLAGEECMKQYNEAVEHFLNVRFDVSKRRLGATPEDNATRNKVALSYGNFLNFCASAGLGYSKVELTDSLKLLQNVDGLGFFDLRKRFVACSVTNTVPLFQEEVELAMMTSASSVLTVADSPHLVNVSPLLVRFFDEADPVAEGQVQEIKKCLEHKVKGSLKYAQELYDKVSSLQRSGKAAAATSTAVPTKKGFQSVMAVPKAASSTTSQEESSGRESEHDRADADQADRPSTPENWFDTDTDLDDTKDGEDKTDKDAHDECESDDSDEEEENEDDKVLVVNDEDEEDEVTSGEEEETENSQQQEQQQFRDEGPAQAQVPAESDEARRCREATAKNVSRMLANLKQLEGYVERQEKRLEQMETWRTKVETGLREEIRNLIEQVKIMKSEGGGGPTNGGEQKKQTVRVTPGLVGGSSEVFAFNTNATGELSVASVRAVFPHATALTYQREGANGGVVRVCSVSGSIFDTPEDGWGGRLYVVVQPRQQQQQQHQQPQQQQTLLHGQSASMLPAATTVGVQHASPLPGSYLSPNPLAGAALTRIPGPTPGYFRPPSNGF